MGLFEEMGRKVEKFKQSATDNADAPTHHCLDCEEEFFTDYDACPECDGDHVVLID